ncbi:hypothetical protein L840_1757 [Mycobacterium sp. MAC_011194_8550]|nr:hypothetical protein L840_1757 [Mycobacterium sp. MAC_011194_8550]
MSSSGRDGHERARDRGENERLADVPQYPSFRGARAPKQAHEGGLRLLVECLLRDVPSGSGTTAAGQVCRRASPTRHGRAVAVRAAAHTRVRGFNFRLLFRNPLWANTDRRRRRCIRHLRKLDISFR